MSRTLKVLSVRRVRGHERWVRKGSLKKKSFQYCLLRSLCWKSWRRRKLRSCKGCEGGRGGEANVRSALPGSGGCASPGHGDGEPRDESHHLLSVRGRDSPAVPRHHLPARLPGDSTRGQRTSDSSGGKDPCQGERGPAMPLFSQGKVRILLPERRKARPQICRELPYPTKGTKLHLGWADTC